jgi:peptidoglycan/xylan/chitin deacetylase (PgdA/CDA1 family)
VALTFDDGPDPVTTPQILDALARHRVRATFFVIGAQAAHYPDLVRRIAAAGHRLGNHSYTHTSWRLQSWREFNDELNRTDALLSPSAAAACLHPFRPPFGEISLRHAWYTTRSGRSVVLWSTDSRDSIGASAAEIAALGDHFTPGEIVLLHDRCAETLHALPELLERVARRGLACVPITPDAQGAPT